MPTNILRQRTTPLYVRQQATPPVCRIVVIKAGRISVRAELADTPTAARLAAALPIHSTAETWGAAIHFEVPVASGRERSARVGVAPGDICFWSSDRRVIVAFGPTPISRPGEIRLPEPCNIWARALDDVTSFRDVRPGGKVSIEAAPEVVPTPMRSGRRNE